MIVQCPACQSRYRIRDANIPPSGGKIRCPQCSHAFIVYPESAEEGDDQTSITSQRALSELVNRSGVSEDRTLASGAELDQLRAMEALKRELGEEMMDGTVEMQNPMQIWKDAQRHLQSLTPVEESEADDDAAPTEIVDPSNISLPFGKPKHEPSGPPRPAIPSPFERKNRPQSGMQPALPRSAFSLPQPAGISPSVHEDVTLGVRVPKESVVAKEGSSPFVPPPIPESHSLLEPPSSPTVDISRPVPPPPRATTPSDSSPSLESPSYQDLFGAGPSTEDGPFAAIEHGDATDQTPAPDLGPPPSGRSFEVPDFNAPSFTDPPAPGPALHEPVPMAAGPDPEHQGPWKLKALGLTYEFADIRSIKNWLSNRDEIDQLMVSQGDENFHPLMDYPQLRRGSSRSIPQISSSGMQPAAPAGLGSPPGPLPKAFGGPGTEAPPVVEQPRRITQPGPRISQEFRPPSQEAKWHGVLWAILLVLILAFVVVLMQTLEIYDVVGNTRNLLGIQKQDAPVVRPIDDIEIPTIAKGVEDPERIREMAARLVNDGKRDIENNRLQSALDRLERALVMDEDLYEAHVLRADALERLGHTEKAQEARDKAQALQERLAAEEDDNPEESEALEDE